MAQTHNAAEYKILACNTDKLLTTATAAIDNLLTILQHIRNQLHGASNMRQISAKRNTLTATGTTIIRLLQQIIPEEAHRIAYIYNNSQQHHTASIP